MELLKQATIDCPSCGESQWIDVDASAGDQVYVEDCQVCCRPMLVSITLPDGAAGDPYVGVRPEND